MTKYCFNCKKRNPKIQCTRCDREFHEKKCLGLDEAPTDGSFVCFACRADYTCYNTCDLSKIGTLINFLLQERQIKPLVQIDFAKMGVDKNFTLQQMATKNYETVREFFDDILWFEHNCRTKYSSNRDIVKAATSIRKLVEDELYNLTLCKQCYLNAKVFPNDSMSKLCEPPHVPLWVDCKEFGIWPAKLMSINENGKVTVRFFGEYKNYDQDPTDCYLYSKEMPVNCHGTPTDTAFKLAVLEVKNYVEEIQKKYKLVSEYGYDMNTPFNLENYKSYVRAITCPITIVGDEDEDEFEENEDDKERETNDSRSSNRSGRNSGSESKSGSRRSSYRSEKSDHSNSNAAAINEIKSANTLSALVNTPTSPTVETPNQVIPEAQSELSVSVDPSNIMQSALLKNPNDKNPAQSLTSTGVPNTLVANQTAHASSSEIHIPASDGATNDGIDKGSHSTQHKKGQKTVVSINNPGALSEWKQKLLDIQNSSEEILQNHFEAIRSEFKKSVNTSAEFVQKVEGNSEKLKRVNAELEESRRKIVKLENDNGKLQAALDEAKMSKHECISCKKQCFKFCIECMNALVIQRST